jgi:hypothetical protein
MRLILLKMRGPISNATASSGLCRDYCTSAHNPVCTRIGRIEVQAERQALDAPGDS